MSPSRNLLFALVLAGPIAARADAPALSLDGGATPASTSQSAVPSPRPASALVLPTETHTVVEGSEAAPVNARQPPSLLPPLPPASPPAERDKWVRARIDEILSRPRLGNAKVGVAVVDVDTGKLVYARNDAALLNPASNMKMITTAAALALLGPEYRFKTVLLADSIQSGSINGNLYLRGYGDPSLHSEELWKLASDLTGLGIKKVSGDLVVDDTWFDEQRVGPGFEQKDEDYPFRAPNGAVSLNYNACSIRVLPGAGDGAPVRVVIEPASPYFTVVNEATTAPHGKTNLTIATREADGHTEVKVSGMLRTSDGAHVEHRRIAHPDLYAGYSLRELLLRRGVKLGGRVLAGAAPPGARVLANHYSAALGVLVRDVNKHSNNFMAEQLLKTIGAETGGKPGTWQKGVDGVARFLDALGIPRGKYKMTNGSGLYDSNRFTAGQLVTLLRLAYRDFRFAADFVGSLALAGADGTIGHRMEGSPAERYVRAKTGTLSGVSCLSGYAGAPGRMPLAFAVLMNDLPDSGAQDARRAQDAIAEALVAYLGGPPTTLGVK